MKSLINLPLFLSVSLCLLPVSGQARADHQPEKAPAPVQKVFVPQGFDDNDNVEVVLHGHFPDSCMKSGPVEAIADQSRHVISIRPEVFVYQSSVCLKVQVPFIQRVALGNLSEGIWRIEVEGADVKEPLPLVVQRARSSAPDEVLYAPVEDVSLLPEPQGKAHRVVVSGHWPEAPEGKCFQLVSVSSKLGADNSLVVLPIAELRNEGECRGSSGMKRVFIGSSVLQDKISDNVLVHVRVLNGESLNKFFEDL